MAYQGDKSGVAMCSCDVRYEGDHCECEWPIREINLAWPCACAMLAMREITVDVSGLSGRLIWLVYE